MPNYTMTLTDVEDKVMSYKAEVIQDWMSNVFKQQIDITKEKIINLNTAHCNKNNIQIAKGEDAQINQAFDLGVVMSALDKKKALIKSMEEQNKLSEKE